MESEYPADTCTMLPSMPRAASLAIDNNSILRAFGTLFGKMRTSFTLCRAACPSATVCVPPPPVLAAAAAASAAAIRPDSERSAVYANPVVSPLITRMPAPESRPLETCSTRPSSRPAPIERLSSMNTSEKPAPVERPFASTRDSTVESNSCDRSMRLTRVILRGHLPPWLSEQA